MLFRPRREDYKHSLAAATEISTVYELEKLANAKFGEQSLPVSVCDLGVNHDISTRYIVCVKLPKYECPQAVGYLLDSPIKLGMTKNKEPNPDRSYDWTYPNRDTDAQECDATDAK